jgi:hypothetical protein
MLVLVLSTENDGVVKKVALLKDCGISLKKASFLKK